MKTVPKFATRDGGHGSDEHDIGHGTNAYDGIGRAVVFERAEIGCAPAVNTMAL